MHSRFEHSLGVMELATQAFDLLALKHRDQIDRGIKAGARIKRGHHGASTPDGTSDGAPA